VDIASHKKEREMSTFKSMMIIGASLAAVAASASAATPRVSDGAYIQAERCAALISSPALGRHDASGINAFLKVQDGGRDEAAYERGQDARENAAREARTAGAYAKSQLMAERDGVCQSYAGGPAIAAASNSDAKNRAN
jgi:hypothetical protein